MNKQLLFVYGTLKQGFTRNSALQNQRFLGTACTKPQYGMYAYGGFPALVDESLAVQSNVNANTAIYGELYEVDDQCMTTLDKIEGVDSALFKRGTIELDTITLANLPLSQNAWNAVESKVSTGYLFCRKLNVVVDCGSLYPLKDIT